MAWELLKSQAFIPFRNEIATLMNHNHSLLSIMLTSANPVGTSGYTPVGIIMHDGLSWMALVAQLVGKVAIQQLASILSH